MSAEENTPVSEPVIISTEKRANFKSLSPKRMRSLLIGVLIIFLVLIGYLIYQNNIALKVGNIIVYKSQYSTLIKEANNQGISRSDATRDIIQYEKQIYAGESLNVTITPDLLKTADLQANISLKNLLNMNSWQKLSGKALAYNIRVVQLQHGGYVGAVYYFPFDLHFSDGIPPSTDPNFGNPQTIQSDRIYALAQANSYRNELMKNQISQSAALSKITSDPKLRSVSSSNQSTAFLFDSNGNGFTYSDSSSEIYPTSVVYLAQTLKPGSYSELYTEQSYVLFSSLPAYYHQNVDSAYYFVYLQNKLTPNPTLYTHYNNIIRTAGVTSNV